MKRVLWLSIGFASLVLAVVGVVLPLLPTTPFLLLAALAFARSSPKWHAWLVNHPRFGPPIRDWNREGAISRRAKIAGVLTMAAVLALSVVLNVNATVLTIQAVVLVAAAAFIVSRPTPSAIGSEQPG